jgi:hypothetical protein
MASRLTVVTSISCQARHPRQDIRPVGGAGAGLRKRRRDARGPCRDIIILMEKDAADRLKSRQPMKR